MKHMKRTISNILLTLALIAGFVGAVLSPHWWVAWFICFPVMYCSVVALIERNTGWVRTY